MSGEYNAYHTWLGIPSEEQPPNHYRLLGIPLFEGNPEVIANAADRQMAHLKTLNTSRQGSLAQKILNEISAAQICLLNAAKKKVYDDELRAQVELARRAAAPPAAYPPDARGAAYAAAVVPPAEGAPAGRPIPPWLIPAIAGGGVLAALLLLVVSVFALMFLRPAPPRVAREESRRDAAGPVGPLTPPPIETKDGSHAGKPVDSAPPVGGASTKNAKSRPPVDDSPFQLVEDAAGKPPPVAGRSAPEAIPLPFSAEQLPRALIGRIEVDGRDVGLAFAYAPGAVLTHNAIASALAARGLKVGRSIRIDLEGMLVVPKDATLSIRQRGGSPGGSTLTLYLEGKKVGSVSDDSTMSEHVVASRQGVYRVRWRLDGRTFGDNNFVEFPDPETGAAMLVLPTDQMLSGALAKTTSAIWRLDKGNVVEMPRESIATLVPRDDAAVAGNPPPTDPAAASPPPPAPMRQPVPAAAARAAAEKLVDDLFGREIALARKPQEKLALVATFREHASQSKDDPAARYVLWDMARALAADAGDATQAVAIVRHMHDDFEIDATAERTAVIRRAYEAVAPIAAQSAVSAEATALAEELVSGEEFDRGVELAALAVDAAQKSRDAATIKPAVERHRQIAALAREFALVKGARQTLDSRPDDTAANATVAQWHWFRKDRFPDALPYLAKATGDVRMAEIVKAELAPPEGGDGQAALADMWYELARLMPEPARSHYLARAEAWYTQALMSLESLARVRAEKKLMEVRELIARGPQA